MKILKSLFVFTVLISLFGAAFSQIRESGTIHGNITDEEGNPLPGVVVKLSGTNMIGGEKFYTTDKNGYYRFPSIPPGPYTVSADIAGFQKQVREGIRLNANLSLTIDFKLGQTVLKEEIVVKANPPTVDVTSSHSGTVVFTTELIQTLPGKPGLDGLFNLAPGVDFLTAYGAGYASSSTYQMDGIYVSDPLYGGINFTVDTNIINEATFQGLGMPAEFGEASGAILTATTKSGSNKLSGMLDFRGRPEGWNSQNKGSIPLSNWYSASMKDQKQIAGNYLETSGQIGGKILQDKLWFFLAGSYDYSTRHPLGTTAVPKSWTPKIFAKLTYQLNKANRFNATFNYHNNRARGVIASATFPPNIDLEDFKAGYYGTASWTSTFSPTAYLDVKVGYNWKQTSQIPLGGIDLPGRYDTFTGKYTDNYYYWSDGNTRTWHISAHLSKYLPDFITGSHDIKVGVELQRDKILSQNGYTGGVWYQDYNGQPSQKLTRNPSNTNAYFGPIVGFFQDEWTITKRLTLNLGLRYDYLYFNIPSDVVGTAYKKGALAPRLGFTYDLFGDRKNVVKFFYGHMYEKITWNMFSSLDTRSFGSATYNWVNGDWVKVIEYLPGEAASVYTVDPNMSQPSIREFSAAFERELFKDTSLSINFYYKTMAAALGPVNMTAKWATYTISNPGPDGVVGTADDLGTLQVYQKTTPTSDDRFMITNPTKGMSPAVLETPWKKMRGVEFVFEKKFSNNWQMIASYHYTKCTGNTDNVLTNLGSNPNNFVNSSNEMVYYYGQPHQFKFQGNFVLPLDISLGVTAQYITGKPVQARFSTLVNNVSTSFYMFPWGGLKYGPSKDVSIKVEKRFRIGDRFILTAFGDCYNLFNSNITTYYTTAGPNFGKITGVQAPRSFMAGARLYF